MTTTASPDGQTRDIILSGSLLGFRQGDASQCAWPCVLPYAAVLCIVLHLLQRRQDSYVVHVLRGFHAGTPLHIVWLLIGIH